MQSMQVDVCSASFCAGFQNLLYSNMHKVSTVFGFFIRIRWLGRKSITAGWIWREHLPCKVQGNQRVLIRHRVYLNNELPKSWMQQGIYIVTQLSLDAMQCPRQTNGCGKFSSVMMHALHMLRTNTHCVPFMFYVSSCLQFTRCVFKSQRQIALCCFVFQICALRK